MCSKTDRVVAPASASNGTLAFSGTNGAPTVSNPIVGRIAFWADDDTSKVNINTASEGTYWDTPRIFSYEDNGYFPGNNLNDPTIVPGMAIAQPVQHEYQRYPGHPATTSLSAVFGGIFFGLDERVECPLATWVPSNGTLGTPISGVSIFNQYITRLHPVLRRAALPVGPSCREHSLTSGSLTVSGSVALHAGQREALRLGR